MFQRNSSWNYLNFILLRNYDNIEVINVAENNKKKNDFDDYIYNF